MPGPYPVVAFGDRHASVPLDEGMAWALGRLVGTHQMACVVDVSDLGSAAARRGSCCLAPGFYAHIGHMRPNG